MYHMYSIQSIWTVAMFVLPRMFCWISSESLHNAIAAFSRIEEVIPGAVTSNVAENSGDNEVNIVYMYVKLYHIMGWFTGEDITA